ncbi:putative periplasmic serine endoprotease DegP-like [Candidatus Filomicrobium marinum]|uniref:Probable periplasmic serine endoprotease DegP-like n=1 Tax=Candidatus Filomicrobium marinum TaxID=1608628 RepID=A0A0D6JK38_9HYPH|nr:Do family serine endopeptidase [Candidatus Filomicrobium marinum]CFX31741.1 putative periplasmic serine endoprotease DegP-like [Candidatus Filomicrobium marinum]CPR22005.1 putative periplasmic serine endoprotease DegP-like [Candidatus Filomicrobium marinum]
MPIETNEVSKTRAGGIFRSKNLRNGCAAAALIAAAGVSAVFFSPPQQAVAQLKPEAQTAEAPFPRAPLTFADIVDKVKPAVVSISVTNGGKAMASNEENQQGQPIPGLPDLPDDHPLHDFFKNLPKEFRGPGGGQPRRPSLAQGSGFVISEDGYVVTNNHVIDDASEIQVQFDQDRKFEAELVGTDPRTDLALLKIKNPDNIKFHFVKFANKPSRVGDWVLAVGNPFGLGGTVTAGILSAQGRDIGSGPYDYLQIDAAVNRGNSGGPTFNLNGDVVGVNTAIYSPSGGNVGIAFAVPAATATDVIAQLKNNGTVSRGWLGVKIQNIDEDTAASLGLKEPKGALVSEVTPNGPAQDAGLETQDAILTVDGSEISDSRDLARKIAAYSPNTKVDVGVWRDGKEKTIKVDLGRFPTSKDELAALNQGQPAEPKTAELDQLGFSLAAANDDNEEGVRITNVDPSSDAARKGLKAGDRVLEVQGVKVSSVDDVVKGLKQAREKNRPAVLLHVMSGNDKRFVAVQLKKS